MNKHHLCQWMSRRTLALLLIRGWEEQTRKHRPVWINETLRTTRTSSWSRISWMMLSSRLYIYRYGESYLVVDVQLVVLPGLQRLIHSCITLHRGVGQNGASAGEQDKHVNALQHRITREFCSARQTLTFTFWWRGRTHTSSERVRI